MTKIQRLIIKRSEDDTCTDFDVFEGAVLETGARAKPVTNFCTRCGAGLLRKSRRLCGPCVAGDRGIESDHKDFICAATETPRARAARLRSEAKIARAHARRQETTRNQEARDRVQRAEIALKRSVPKIKAAKVTKKAKIKTAKRAKRRTSMWLDDDLRARLDRKAEKTERSLAFTIDDMLRKGLAKAEKGEPDASATVFG